MIKLVSETPENFSEDYNGTVSFEPKKYSTFKDWLAHSIDQFMYEESELELLIATFLKKGKRIITKQIKPILIEENKYLYRHLEDGDRNG